MKGAATDSAPSPRRDDPDLEEKEGDYFAKALPGHLMKDDPSLNWFQKPHTVTMFIVAGIVVLIAAFSRDQVVDTETNVKIGLVAAAGAFLVFSVLYLHDGPFRRPHPAVWRFVTGIGIVYLLSLLFLLFQTRDFVRNFLRYIDPRLGVPLPERSYAEHCDLYTPDHPTSNFHHLMETVNDEFVIAHVVGWFAKALLLRDAYLCVFLSILFEVWELSLQHQLPNFAECWWDHLILDILVCNNLGIFCGMLTCRYLLKVKEYNWGGLWATKKGKLIQTFVPADFDEFSWDLFQNWRRFVSVILFCIAISIIELNAFYLKYILWVPPPHPLNIARLFLWMFMGLPAAREYYQFVVDKNCHKMGSMAWLCLCIFSTEALICIKFGMDMFPHPAPPEVFWPWVIVLSVGSIFLTAYFVRKEMRETKRHPHGADGGGKASESKKKRRSRKKNKKTASDVSDNGGASSGSDDESRKNK